MSRAAPACRRLWLGQLMEVRCLLTRRALLMASAALLGVAGSAAALARFRRDEAALGDPIVLPGLESPIEVLEDRFGIPHVRAGSVRDAFFAQGYLVARDRLFQMDLDLRRDLGRMAEAFGPAFIAADRAARLFHYRGDIAAELAAIPEDVQQCVAGYVDGINARLDELAANPSLLPDEYAILGIAPLRWTMEDCIRRRGSGGDDADEEVRRAMLAARDLLDFELYREPLRPDWTLSVPEGLDVAAVSRADLGVLNDFDRSQPFDPDILAGLDPDMLRIDMAAYGSNAWTVAASRTSTGRPILANDPHLAIGGFSPRHIVHLTAPGLDVIGAGYPGLPGIMQGHTDRFAFGRTNFHIDQTDLFVLRLNPDDPQLYWHHGEWKRFEIFEEEIVVREGINEQVVVRYAKGRPVISHDPDTNRAIVLSTVTMLPGSNMRFAIAAINLARDWDSLREAFRLHVSPTNLHYADIEGNTGWHAIGYAPRRPRHDGLFPAPGDGEYDWEGMLPLEEMPSIYNPEAGWIASANDMNLPADYPYAERILSFTWTDPFRHRRIDAVLGEQQAHSLADSVALLHDTRSLPALALQRLLPARLEPTAERAARMLRGWDGRLTAESNAALLYEMVLPVLSSAFREKVIPPEARDLISQVNLSVLIESLEAADPRLGDDPAAARDELIEDALVSGWEKAVEIAGPDPAKWRWGDLHRVNIRHPLSDIPAISAAFPEIEDGRSGGDGSTVMARGMRGRGGLDVRHGASFLFAADVGNWDETRFLMLPGQSADPASSHYADFYEPWLAGDMQRWAFSREAVDLAAVRRFVLRPAER